MTNKTKNEPAFPRVIDANGNWLDGLSKREWLAGLAMQGLLASEHLACALTTQGKTKEEAANIIAEAAVQNTDALLTQLEKGR